MSKLAIFGGESAVKNKSDDIFMRNITKEMEDAVLDVLHQWKMSSFDITKEFEKAFADWHKMKYGLGCNNGTSALHCAMYGAGIGVGDEIICQSTTYWASCLPVFSLGGTVVFADIDPETLCIDPDDIEHRISGKTKAIMVVHYAGMPADMDRIMPIARKYNLKIIEDVSHSHNCLYKGKMVGTFGDVSGFSLMSGKSFAVGEAGIMLTDDRDIYERALLFGHYERHSEIINPELQKLSGLPWGGYKYRMHQMSSAIGLVQIKQFQKDMVEIDKAMNYFWDILEGYPGIKAHRPPKNSGSTKGGWYCSLGLYKTEELEGLSITRFCEALRAEGVGCSYPGCNRPLHIHPVFNDVDIYGHGKPTRIVNATRDVREKTGSLPNAEALQKRVFGVPWFRHYWPERIEEYANAFKKVIENYKELLQGDTGDPEELGGWHLSKR
ncbi:MAG TPA: DegT/DnrJ/EryC1/StrS family aminotransferase [bacterium]|jgi:dTDP-4-amino-4,6-dideoxygalactose transaminase|nr:DegT/DnrJ/EryC1/StrS family aminotransferase [bacterium]HON05736.1 DegT/DnrJ/EryC1/StrS family aminotransferase [bacterium]HOQ82374.1 DegT/DnrJ/EryC1/StrS family aminotransferase [bacterium]HPC29061.1 DegT/DnrJ/EryC1/StrS family aminotransferase [bacterium]